MEKKVRIVSKEEAEKSDIEYWRKKSSEERLDAVQHLRELWIKKFHNRELYDESRKRLRSVYKITKRT